MHVKRYRVTLTTDASGDATGYTEDVGSGGEVKQILYTKTDFANGVDFVITGETTGVVIWDQDDVNASELSAPQAATELNTTGAAATYDGTRVVLKPIVVANERIKVVVASGGDTKIGTVDIWIGG